MKTVRFFATFAILMMACTLVSASETAENFAQWVPNFASSDTNQRRTAQQNWQNFCRQKGNNPDVQKEIIRVSLEQLAKENPVETSVWIIRQLGAVGDATAVPALARLLSNAEVRIRDEAARALANIPGTEAANALRNSSAIATAQLARDALTSRAIKADIPRDNGVETQMPMAVPFLPPTSNAEITALLEKYPSLSDMEKSQVLSNLTNLALRRQVNVQLRRLTGGPTAARPTGAGPGTGQGQGPPGMAAGRGYARFIPLAIEAVQSTDETLRNTAVLAVGALGGPEQVPFLLELARTGGNRGLAVVALSRMSGQAIDALLLENLKTETDAGKFDILADVLNRRFNQEIRPLLLTRAQAAGTTNRLQLLQWVRPTSTEADVPDFVKVWAMIEDRGEKDRAEQEIAELVQRNATAVMQALGGNWDTPEGMTLLGRVGDARTLNRIRQGQHAMHAFRTWPNAVVADDLLAIARDTNRSADDRIATLRAFTRVMSLPGTRPQDQIGIQITDVEKVNRLAAAYELATRVDEKRLIIERVGQIRTIESLRFVLKYIDEADLRERACESVLDLARDTNFRRSQGAEVTAALDKVIAVTTNNNFRTRAEGLKAAN